MELQHSFLAVMREISASVWILANSQNHHNQAITVSSFTSASIEPPTILCCINHQAGIHQSISQVDSLFSANLLTNSQQDLAILCSDNDKVDLRFEHSDWSDINSVNTTIPYLKNTAASIICRTISATSIHTHSVIIAKVERVISTQPDSQQLPLVYHNRKFGVFSS